MVNYIYLHIFVYHFLLHLEPLLGSFSFQSTSFMKFLTKYLLKVNFASMYLKISFFNLPSFLKCRVLGIEFGTYWSFLSVFSKYCSTLFWLPLML